MSGLRLPVLLVLFLGVAIHGVSRAGFDEALKAYQAKDFPLALSEARKAADAGEPRGSMILGVMYQNGQGVTADHAQAVKHFEKAAQGGVVNANARLAQAHARGQGVAKDRNKALALARRAAQQGDAEGAFLVSVILTGEFLGYLDANGKPDRQRYMKLAGRPLSERAMDIEAHDALYWSADKSFPPAMMTLAMSMGGSIGDGNRQRLQALMAKLPNVTYPALLNYQKIASYMDTLGQSNASPQAFVDAQAPQMLAAAMQACGLRDGKDAAKLPPPRLVSIKVSKPLGDAVYLPSRIPGYERAYLVSGQWEEAWTYTACDKQAQVTVRFKADGLGGTQFSTTPNAKQN